MDSHSGTYEELAEEYYDARLHPTCANFREASALLIDRWLGDLVRDGSRICETGAGRSLVAELLARRGRSVRRLAVLDSSRSMLGHSVRAGASRLHVLAEARALPFPDRTLDLVVSVLGDAYNDPLFWKEVRRVLSPSGWAIYTGPAHGWATRFRPAAGRDLAEFALRDGRTILVPSVVRPEPEQIAMVEKCGLRCAGVAATRRDALDRSRLSPKLEGPLAPNDPVVTGYLFARA